MEDLASQIQPGAGAWEKMEARLSLEKNDSAADEIIADQEFDKSIREKLKNKTNYASKNWKKLSDQLELQEERVRSVYRHKLLESAIIFILFYTVQNLFDLPQLQQPKGAGIIYYQTNHSQQANQLNSSGVATLTDQVSSTINSSNPGKSISIPLATVKKLNAAQMMVATHSSQAISAPASTHESDRSEAMLSFLQHDSKTISSNSATAGLSLSKADKKQKKHRYSLGFVTVLNINEIHTPKDVFLGKEIDSYNRYNLGAGGGFTFSREGNHFSAETGLVYLSKRYSPKQLSVIGQNMKGVKFQETLNNVQVNMLEIPFNYLYRFNRKNKKTCYYGGVGATVNLITQANYDNDRNYFVPVYALSSLDNSQPPSEIKKIKKFNYGLFEGGTFRENTYLSAQLLLGLEYRINEKFSFFNQATFQRQISARGIGANRNYFNAYSVWVGLKTHF
ncbi:MAG: hypothetical protein ACOYOA_16070 [Saprospiraceae bacterium]